MALSRRTGGRSRLTIALLVLTSLALLTLDFRDAAVVQSVRRAAGTVLSPLQRGGRDGQRAVHERLARGHRLRRPEGPQRRAPEADRGARGRSGPPRGRRPAAGRAARAAGPRVGGGHPHHRRAGGLREPVELLPLPRHQQGQRRRHQGGHAGRQRCRPGRQGRAGHQRPVHRPADHRPRLRGGRAPPPERRHRDRTRPGAGRGPRRRHRPGGWRRARTCPSRGPSLTTSGVDSSAFPASIPVGKVREVREAGGGLTLEPPRATDGRHREAGLRHRAALASARSDPAQSAHRWRCGPR